MYFRFNSNSTDQTSVVSVLPRISFGIGLNSRSARRDIPIDSIAQSAAAATLGQSNPTLVPGLSGSTAISFDGNSRADFRISTDSANQVLYQFTASVWINPSSRASGVPILAITGFEGGIEFRTNPANNLVVPSFRLGASQFIYGPASSAVNNGWIHLAVTVADTNYSFYVNGTKVSVLNSTALLGGRLDLTVWKLGCEIGVAAGGCFVGSMDEFAVYSAGVSESDVQEIFDRGVDGASLNRDAPLESGASSGGSTAIIGAVVAVLLILIICIVVFIVMRRRSRRQAGTRKSTTTGIPMQENSLKTISVPVPVPASGVSQSEQYRVLYNYTPAQSDELEVTADEIVIVSLKNPDGWYHCKSTKTHKSGVVPSNYLQQLPVASSNSSNSTFPKKSPAPSAPVVKSTWPATPKATPTPTPAQTTAPISTTTAATRSASPPPPPPPNRPPALKEVKNTSTSSASLLKKAPQKPLPSKK